MTIFNRQNTITFKTWIDASTTNTYVDVSDLIGAHTPLSVSSFTVTGPNLQNGNPPSTGAGCSFVQFNPSVNVGLTKVLQLTISSDAVQGSVFTWTVDYLV